MYLKPHQWISDPYTSYEIRREMRVRETRHTVMVWDKKYYDSDIGKFKTDKLHTIYSSSIADIMDSGEGAYFTGRDYYQRLTEEDELNNRIPKFVPKDNDFDEECRRDEEKKRQQKNDIIAHKKILTQQQAESLRLKQEYIKQQYLEEKKRIEAEYQLKVKEIEDRLMREKLMRGRESVIREQKFLYPTEKPKLTRTEMGEKMMEEARAIRAKYAK